MPFYPEERMALFIDGSNLYSSARNLGFDVDYKKLYRDNPAASGEATNEQTLHDPADSPKIVTRCGSPPKAAMFRCTQPSVRISLRRSG